MPPLWVRGGAILALGPVVQWSDERPVDPLTLHVYPDESGHAAGELYEDDGTSYAYERGVWRWTRYTFAGGSLEARGEGPFRPPPRTAEARLHGEAGSVTALPSPPD
jgi:alpha-glucosidase